MRFILVVLALLLITSCDPRIRYQEVAYAQCGASDYAGSSQHTIMARHNCIAPIQRQLLAPTHAYPDIISQAIAENGVAAQRFARGEINALQFDALLANIETQRINAVQARYQATKPDVVYVQQPIPSLRPRSFTCNSTGSRHNSSTQCTEDHRIDTSVFHRLGY